MGRTNKPGGMVEVMDTTLRDGEQTTGVSFNEKEKLAIARLLLNELRVDRIEVASARVSRGEFESVRRITDWAKQQNCLDRVEVLGFIDGGLSLNWIEKAGGRVINLLAKGSLRHLTGQLRKTPEQHLSEIISLVETALLRDMVVNVYLEDWSNGMIHSVDYVYFMMDSLKDCNIRRFMLPDTLGVLNPDLTTRFSRQIKARYPDIHFDFHAHNDYDMATANVYCALKEGFQGVHTTVNGLGERCGNVPLSSVLALLNDHLGYANSLNESRLYHVSKMVERFSGLRIPANKPLIGENAFTQCCGVHADGDNKAKLYENDLLPERFGRSRVYALGKTSGKANIINNLKELGIELTDDDILKVTGRVIEMGDKKEKVTVEDLPYIINDVLDQGESGQSIRLINYHLTVARDLRPVASVSISIEGKVYDATSVGFGQYDAFMKALWNIYERIGMARPGLVDYEVTIPPGGKTDALVETIISWEFNGRIFRTRGLDADQTTAAIQATLRMLNLLADLGTNSPYRKGFPATKGMITEISASQ
jgi:(R)-citramalate synthase